MMRMCLKSYGPQPYPLQLGYTWIKPDQWVVVQIVPVIFDEGYPGSGEGDVTVVTGNGMNTIVNASLFNPGTCGSSITLASASGNATEAVVAA